MGLNIGMTVQQQVEYAGYSGPYIYPKESLEELNEKFCDFLEQRFPQHRELSLFGHSIEFNPDMKVYTLDCRLSHYGDEFGKAGYKMEQLYEALFAFVLTICSYDDLQVRTYHSP